MTFVPYYLSVVFESLTLVLVLEGILPKFWRLFTKQGVTDGSIFTAAFV